MVEKFRYTLSAVERDKLGSGWHIRAVPNAYAPELTINFVTEAEAHSWLENESAGWLAKAQAQIGTKTPKRPRDPNQLAKLMVDIAAGDVQDKLPQASETTPMAILGRAGGLKGGKARAEKLSDAERTKIAKNAAAARWKERK